MSQPDSKTILLSDPKAASAPRGVYVGKPSFNVYTMMLVLSLVALVIGSVFFYLELTDYGPGTPWSTAGY